MRRPTAIAATMLVLLAVPLIAQDPFAPKPDTPQRFPNPYFQLAPGKRATVDNADGRPIFAGASRQALADYGKARDAKDEKGIDELLKYGEGVILADGTRVNVIKVSDLIPKYQDGMLIEARVEGGPQNDKLVFLFKYQLADLIDFPLKEGEEGVIDARPFADRMAGVPVASSREAYSSFILAWQARDDSRLSRLTSEKVLAIIPPGIRVTVKKVCCSPDRLKDLGLAGRCINVELLSGKLKGNQVWIHPSAVARPGTEAIGKQKRPRMAP